MPRMTSSDGKTGIPWQQRSFCRLLIDMHIPDWDEAFLSEYSPQIALDDTLIGGGLLQQERYGLCCFNHPDYRHFVASQITEIVTGYAIDGFFCRRFPPYFTTTAARLCMPRENTRRSNLRADREPTRSGGAAAAARWSRQASHHSKGVDSVQTVCYPLPLERLTAEGPVEPTIRSPAVATELLSPSRGVTGHDATYSHR